MGLLRLLLAVSVVLAHAGPICGYRPLESAEAVQTFYMISGFYMALILSQKYTGPGSYRLFLANRFLRIYPTYWFVLIISVVVWFFAGRHVGEVSPLSVLHAGLGKAAVVLLIMTNVLLIGQDAVMFSGVNDHGGLRFTSSFSTDARPLWQYLLVPQAWSLSIELMFYAVVPLIVRWRTRWILLTMATCAIIRIGLFLAFHFRQDPWTYRFAPSELLLFSAGILAYRAFIYFERRRVPRPACAAATVATLLMCMTYQWIHVSHLLKQWSFYCVIWTLLPLIFIATKHNLLDRRIGELSYPVYLSHWLFVVFLPPFLTWTKSSVNPPTAILISTMLFSILLIVVLTSQVERVRRRVSGRLHPNSTR